MFYHIIGYSSISTWGIFSQSYIILMMNFNEELIIVGTSITSEMIQYIFQ